MPTDGLAEFVSAFMIIITRLSPIVFFLPGMGEEAVPVRVRLMVTLGLSATITSLGLVAPVPMFPFPSFLFVLLSEALVGMCLGISLKIVSWVLSAAGAIIAQMIGLAQFVGQALQTEAQTITANFLSMAGAALLVTADFHLTVLKALFQMYQDLPAGQVPALDTAFFIQNVYSAREKPE